MKPFLFLFLLLPGVCFARIGETLGECVVRYGQPVKKLPGTEDVEFAKSGYIILASFLDGKVIGMCFKKAKTDAQNIPEQLTSTEIEQLMSVNGAPWKSESSPPAGVKKWSNTVQWEAFYSQRDHILVIVSRKGLDHTAAERLRKEKEQLKGF